MKKTGSHGRHLQWFQMLLVLLLAGQTSSAARTSTSPLPPPTTTKTTAPTSAVFYFLNIAVDVGVPNKNESDIEDRLYQVFQTELESCVSPTTVSPHTTSASTANETTPTTTAATTTNNTSTTISTTLESNTTTATPLTTVESNTTTASTLTTVESNTTTATPLTTVESNTTTASTLTTVESNTTTATTLTTVESNTTAVTVSTTVESNTTTATPSSTMFESITTTATTPSSVTTSATNLTASDVIDATVATTSTTSTTSDTTTDGGLKSNLRVVREVGGNVTETSGLSNTTGLFQGLELSCTVKTAITKTNCSVKLQLKQEVPPCCILRTLCATSKMFPHINVVGERADRIGPLNECSSNPQEKKSSCIYKSPGGSLCSEYEDAFVESGDNSTGCNLSLKTCNCTDYCNKTDAYYTFHLSIHDSNVNISYILSLFYKLRDLPPCSLGSEATGSLCTLSIIATEYKDVRVTCVVTDENLESCRVILAFSHEVPICNVSAAVAEVFRPIQEISFDGLVTRAAICGNSGGDNPLNSLFTWVKLNLDPSVFCPTIEVSNILTCQNGKNVVAQLAEQCLLKPFTTPSPNMTTTQPNTTATPVNVTSPPLNTTTEPLNTTTTPVNVTSPPLNTTTEPLNTTTTPVNVTSPPLNTTTEPLNTTTIPVNVTSPPVNTTAEPLNTTTTTASTPTTTESGENQANALLEQTKNVSALNSSQVDQLVSQLENLLSGPNVSIALGNTSVHIVSNLLGAPAETLANSSNRIINIVDTVGLKLVLSEQAETLLSPAVALSVKTADGANFQETFFSISDPSNVQVRGDARLRRRSVRADSSIPQGSIRLPPSLTQNLTSEEQQLVSRVQFNFYQRSTVFQDRSLGQRKLNSGILGASVANLSIRGLADDVVIRLRNMEPVPANFVATCVFWDFTLNDESGGWNPNGCSVQNSTDNETVCGCNHLTSFAILLDLSRQPVTSRLQATILTFITYIGCGVSAIFLSITLLTYLAFGKLRKDIPSKILIQLCLALLLLNLAFLVDAWLALYPEAVGLCISTAWFLHYFLLVSFTWMGLEAVHMYLALVKVFNTYVSRYMLKFSLVGWGIPMVVVIIVIAIDKDNYGLVSYGRFSDGTSDDFCWLKNDIAFYVAVVAYFCVIFLFNFIMFIMVLVQLYRIKRQNPHNMQHRSTLQDVRSVTGITLLLGLTWGFAFFAWGPVNLAFMYLFAIFNSLQGFFIFIFHCAVKENVRRQWRTYLCCGKMRLAENSDWSRTATQKTVKKSSVTRLTSLHSSNSNNLSSSTSFLVSDSSDHMNGFGNPMDDRAITADEDPGMDVILNEVTGQRRSRQAH